MIAVLVGFILFVMILIFTAALPDGYPILSRILVVLATVALVGGFLLYPACQVWQAEMDARANMATLNSWQALPKCEP